MIFFSFLQKKAGTAFGPGALRESGLVSHLEDIGNNLKSPAWALLANSQSLNLQVVMLKTTEMFNTNMSKRKTPIVGAT